uniref:Uncharacterized protein n=1 Tax=Octopus bimaculoides TaxID=37653 RepID=A0A0L8H4B2_OCTBM
MLSRDGRLEKLNRPTARWQAPAKRSTAWNWSGAGVHWDGRRPRSVKQSSLGAGGVLWKSAPNLTRRTKLWTSARV